MDGRRIILHDGTTFDGECGYSGGFLWCYVNGVSNPEDVAIFLNAEATSVILFQYGDMEDTYTGYVFNLMIKTETGYSVSLEKGV